MNIMRTNQVKLGNSYYERFNAKGNLQNSQINTPLKNISANYLQKATAADENAKKGFQVLHWQKNVDDIMAGSIINTADEGLSEAEIILNKIQELLNASNDLTKHMSDDDMEKINEELQGLLESLDQLSDNNLMLDGSFGGIQGKDGILDMGISQITSAGNINGKVKFNISFEQNRLVITARNGNQCVTNKIKFSDTESTFKFGESSITLKFKDVAGNLKPGVIKDVSFLSKDNNADLTNTVSCNKKSNDVYHIKKNGDKVKIPDLMDISSVGLGLNGITIKSIIDVKQTLTKLKESLTRIDYVRKQLYDAKVKIIGFDGRY